ncbi:MAG: beta-ketoacyl synthase chain length factor [Proteobacteria bacterium]|nr:beta-ketoacyl synthase chain length factor [Pseudomonadota bacterium]
MSLPGAWIEGVGLIGPGLSDWPTAAPALTGSAPWNQAATCVPALQVLPAAERRRAGLTVRLALATGLQAVAAARAEASRLNAVFTSSSGDGQNCHEICVELAGTQRQISPTRFHNSVHNAAAGYWGIATGARTASTALCAHDGSFAAGLIEALLQTAGRAHAVLLVAHDAPYPSPLREARPIPDAFAVALVLSPRRTAAALARIGARLTPQPGDAMPGPLEALRQAIPAARALPLLGLLARAQRGTTVLDYLDDLRLAVEIEACT